MEFEAPELPDSTVMNASFVGRQKKCHDSLFPDRRDSLHNRDLGMYAKANRRRRDRKVRECRPRIRISGTRKYDLGQYDVPISDRTHLPVKLQFYVLMDTQLLLEAACFKWLKQHHPGILASCHWTHELDTELHLFHRQLNGHKIKENTLRLTANQRTNNFLGLLDKVDQIRHSAVHRT
ncbi:uncharacterized protein EAE97_007177 [Botrytis byssoidea]|uniref:Uncharacterized protein n=1 Tax=Botrytis byssoidea TaxID=139641 RepID=A0A9P5IIT9_9HELO|nr:uncharacterized protein EAE97_007177 [Botrytis byssoidea]KAF7939096.1 hypothetical protein EAE97_007177 [Botrytis byssoidea]